MSDCGWFIGEDGNVGGFNDNVTLVLNFETGRAGQVDLRAVAAAIAAAAEAAFSAAENLLFNISIRLLLSAVLV